MTAARLAVIASIAQSALSIKLGSFNTFQVPSNTYAPSLAPYQLEALSASDIDVLCLQEMFLPNTTIEYLTALAELGNYTDSFSMLDVLSPSDLTVPRTPCLGSSVPDALTSTCSDTYCRTYYDDYGSAEGYAYCMAQACPDEFAQFRFTECVSCVGAYLTVHAALGPFAAALGYPDVDLESGINFCNAPLSNPTLGLNFDEYLFNNTDGLAIASRYPIVNTWSVQLPAWLFVPRRVALAEIDVCSETRPGDAECDDSIVVGCTHLHSGIDIFNDVGVVQSPLLDVNWVTSHNGLNRYQTEYVLQNLYNDDLLVTLGREDDADSILAVFLMGDTNNGQMFDRCSYTESPVDNCDEEPTNNFDLFAAGGLIDAPNLVRGLSGNVSALELRCTWCVDDSRDDFNEFTYAKTVESGIINSPESSCDVDHILIQQGYEGNIASAVFEREFMEAIVEDVNPLGINGAVTMSDHYGVSLTIEFE